MVQEEDICSIMQYIVMKTNNILLTNYISSSDSLMAPFAIIAIAT